MYLSRLVLNPRSRAVRKDLGDCRGLHRTILSAFPQVNKEHGGARLEFGILFRTDTESRSGKVTLLVQSQAEPDWSRLPNDYLLDNFDEFDNPALKNVDAAYGTLRTGMRLRFRLRANPTRRISEKCAGEKSNGYGKRVEIYGEEKQVDWLRRKGDQHGFQLLSVQVNPGILNVSAMPESKLTGLHEKEGRKYRMAFGSTLFEGKLEITDADAFRLALVKGIGSGKAFGFGLLSIARAPD